MAHQLLHMAMFKKILVTILTVFLLNQAKAQPSQYTPMTANGYQMKRVKVDSTLHIPSFCGVPTLNGSTSPMGAIAYDTCNNKLYKYNSEFGWTEVAGGSGTTPTLQQVLTQGATVTSNNIITGATTTTIKQTGSGIKAASLLIDTTQLTLSNVTTGSSGTAAIGISSSSISNSSGLTSGAVVTNGTSSYLRFTKVFPSLNYNFGISEQGAYWLNGSSQYYFPITQGTTGQVLKLSSASQLSWANDSSGGSTIDTTSLSNRIDSKIDSLKRSTDSVFAYKNGTAYFQYKDSIGGGSSVANDTAKVVIAKVHNATGTTLQRGEVVYLSGANGDVASVKRANNKQDSTSSKTFGIVRRDIAAGDTGYITTQGQIEKLNLGSYSPGDILWLDSIDGQFTKVVPQAPYHSVFLGVVERANNGNGLMYVKPQNGYELGEIHDVQINNKVNNQILVYSDTQQVWKNRSAYTVIDTTKLQQKSLPAYSIMGNNTNAAANPTAVYYKDTAGTYSGSIVWTPPGGPTGTTNHSYRWTRIGNLVTLNISLVYGTAGGTLSQVVVPLPADAPTPAKPAGLTGASNTLYPVLYQFVGNIAASPPNATQRAILRSNAANNGFEIVALNTATTIIATYFTVQYTAQ